MKKILRYTLAAGLAALASALPAHAGVIGAPFKAHVALTFNEGLYDAVGTWNGESSVLWVSSDGNTRMRRFNASGVALDAGDINFGNNPWNIDFDRLGNYVTVRSIPDGDSNGVFATVRNRSGVVVVPEFRVNPTIAGRQDGSALAVSPSGQFAVAWMDQTNGIVTLFVRAYNANGTPASPAISFNTAPGFVGGITDLEMDAAGNFVIGWINYSQATSADSYVRRYSFGGIAQTSHILVSAGTANLQDGLRLGMNAQGQFAACWNSWNVDGDSYSIHYQLFTAAAAKVGTEQRANVTTAGAQYQCDVGMMDNGSSLVIWNNNNRAAVPSSIPDTRLRQYNANGTPFSASETVLPPAAGTFALDLSHVGVDPAGNALIAWTGRSTTGTDTDVWVQRFRMDTAPATTALASGQTVTGLSGVAASWRYYQVNIPAGAASMTVSSNGPGVANPELYLRLGAQPTTSAWDIRPAIAGPNETIIVNNPLVGEWYIGIYGQTAYSGLNLSFTRN
ncbi:hypothetical protein D0B54_17430 [Solimonas sp. K1W22B-7]|uniref:PPC domain-containing protein n=1 Tax=Solimonas sp. K1W22B-7 TaxID=2303331 RepID=UPI000E335A14|nr:PPC domain-containing protein [Solimonas sp. K1W22B-7]AXQ30344.1 hypothetical protein D0B54_17430 [Solimonas sp. K1W22B-7]